MLVKTTKITNPRNVLVQIPSFILAEWEAHLGSNLEVHYDEFTKQITINKAIQRRGNIAEQSD